jgi:glycosyltransferase involved in cell wall biosynthesis
MQALLNRLSTLEPFDIVHVNDSSMASYQLPRRAPRILSELEVRGYGEAADNDAEARRWQRYLPRAWRQFDRVQVLTGQDAAALGTMAQDVIPRVRINPFGVRLPPSLALEEQPGEVVFVGGFNHPPNVDAARWMVHDIMPQVRTQVSEVRLTLVGKDPPEEVRALAGTDVAVTGRVPSVEPYLRRAAVILAPLRTGGGMRMKVLQAMAFGKPVVTTPLGAEGLVGERDELPVVVGRDASQLAWETARLLTDEVARRDLGQRARAFVAEHHTWEAYLNRLEGTYQELASSRAST